MFKFQEDEIVNAKVFGMGVNRQNKSIFLKFLILAKSFVYLVVRTRLIQKKKSFAFICGMSCLPIKCLDMVHYDRPYHMDHFMVFL